SVRHIDDPNLVAIGIRDDSGLPVTQDDQCARRHRYCMRRAHSVSAARHTSNADTGLDRITFRRMSGAATKQRPEHGQRNQTAHLDPRRVGSSDPSNASPVPSRGPPWHIYELTEYGARTSGAIGHLSPELAAMSDPKT